MEFEINTELILNSINHGIIITDAEGYIVSGNEHAKNLFSYDLEKKVGKNISDIFPEIGDFVSKCLESEMSLANQHLKVNNVHLTVTISPIRSNNRAIGAICNFNKSYDLLIFDQKDEPRKGLDSELNTIFKSTTVGIWVVDIEGRVLHINKVAAELNGISAEKIIGKRIKNLDKKGIFDISMFYKVLKNKEQLSIMKQVAKLKRRSLVTYTPIFDEEGNIFCVVINERDMNRLNSIRKQLEHTRMVSERYKDKLIELSMMELKEQEIIAESQEMRQVLKTALKLSHLNVSNVLILGESGTGKGLLAKFIHNNSKRKKKPFIHINCAALPESILEAELFGYEKGAFTGAKEEGKVGLFELADEGTLFLDEIGDLPLNIQAKLLKYLDDYEILRLGATETKKVDCNIIAATNRNLDDLINAGKFRSDLFFRLNSFTIQIQPLRKRAEDIFGLTNYFLNKFNDAYHFNKKISPKSHNLLQSYHFPGNVRELMNVLKKAVVMSDTDLLDELIEKSINIKEKNLFGNFPVQKGIISLTEGILSVEKEILKRAINRCRSTRQMANYLGMSQPTIVRKLKKHGLTTN